MICPIIFRLSIFLFPLPGDQVQASACAAGQEAGQIITRKFCIVFIFYLVKQDVHLEYHRRGLKNKIAVQRQA